MASSTYEQVKKWRALPESKVKRAAEAKRWREKHPEVYAEIRKRYRSKDPDKVRQMDTESAGKRRKADPEGNRRRMLAWRDRREAKFATIAGRPRPEACDLCGGNQGGICFDHDHANGAFRGWLCDRCNKVLGLVKDSPALLSAMCSYLLKEPASEKKDGTNHG